MREIQSARHDQRRPKSRKTKKTTEDAFEKVRHDSTGDNRALYAVLALLKARPILAIP